MAYSRPLTDKDQVRHFLNQVLEYDYEECKDIVSHIVDGEIGIANKSNYESQTLTSTKVRNDEYLEENSRWRLRKQIIKELIESERLENDEQISLGKGGILPLTGVKSDRQAIIIIGLPASGKSSIASKIADNYGAVILDSDFAKRKLPEFNVHIYGATIVHEESSQITFGFQGNRGELKSVYESCLENGYNMVIPKIGESPKKIFNLAKALKEQNNYDIHLISVELTKRDATIRAIKRFNETKRYVPLGLIFDQYGNDSHLCYYFLRCKYPDLFKSFGALSNNVPLGQNPVCTDIFGESSPASDYKEVQNLIPL
ncbi:hypothetical protein FACS1894169_11160 [Bacteroidia bacterium]|nr:hypothetical protein FACS1894169_11160 [Bacteroidia bacterium]